MIEVSNSQKMFGLSNAELYLFTSRLIESMRRDLSQLTEYGVTEAKILALNTLNEQVNSLPSDDILKSDYSYAVDTRNQIRTTVEKTTKSIGVRAKNIFYNNPSRLKVLNYLYIAQMTDIDLFATAEDVHRNAITFLEDLKTEGITQAYLDMYENDIEQFKIAINTAKEKNTLRNEATQNRTESENKLYALVCKYCDYGKSAFEGGSTARYNEYVIYPPSAGSLKAPTGLKFSFTYKSFTWNIEKNATSYQFEYSADGINFVEVYAGMNEYCEYTPANEGWSYYRVRARNANGYGPYSDVLKQGYYATLPAPTNLKAVLVSGTVDEVLFTWDELPSAIDYSVNMSIVAIGAAPGTLTFKEKVKTTSYTLKVEQGKRYYFALTAGTGYQWSGMSDNCFIDVV